jgi:glycosyltransferase involved in cell wall biosynthesis
VSVDPPPITAVILTYNEELNLASCLRSLVECVSEIFVVDSGSSDKTLTIAKDHRAIVIQHPFETHARQWAWALEHLPCRHEWILGLDADQRLTPELGAEIARLFRDDSATLAAVDGFYVKRRQVFRGQWIRFGGYYPKHLLKLVRRNRVSIDTCDLVDHHFVVRGRTEMLRHDLIEENKKEDDISFWTEKHIRYAALLAQEELLRETAGAIAPVVPALLGSPDERALWRKRLWRHLPHYLRPFMYFGYRYFLRLGFLDGKQGLIFHFLHACWFRLLIDVKLDEARGARELQDRNAASTAG